VLWLILVASMVISVIVGLGIAKLVKPLVRLPVFGITCTVSVLGYESTLRRSALLLVADISIAIAWAFTASVTIVFTVAMESAVLPV
jgi:hypothetical protein